MVAELEVGSQQGYNVPKITVYPWMKRVNPNATLQEWLSLELGQAELAVLELALEHRENVVLLDDFLARKIAQAAGLKVRGTLRVLLEAKERQLIKQIAPYVEKLAEAGMWLSEDIRHRILCLAGEFS